MIINMSRNSWKKVDASRQKVILLIFNTLSFLFRLNPSIFLWFFYRAFGAYYLKSVIFVAEKTLKSVVFLKNIEIDKSYIE